MTAHPDLLDDPRILAAIEEIHGLITARFPDATFTVGLGEDPNGVHLRPVVDVEDRWEVIDLYSERLTDLQDDDGLPLYVIPGRPPERNAAIWRALADASREVASR